MSILALSGLASGVDTGGIVAQLMALERQSLTRIQLNQARVTARDTGLKEIQSKLSAFKTAATALKAASTWDLKQTVASSDANQVGVEKLSGLGGVGGTAITVTRLATASKRDYTYNPEGAAETLTFNPAVGPDVVLNVAANTSLTDLISQINASTTAPVYAADVGGQLVLSSRTTGSNSTFTAVSSSGNSQLQTSGALTSGVNAAYTVNGGGSQSSETNVIDTAIPGVRLTLKALTTTGVTISVGEPAVDQVAIKAKLTAFVDAYNAVNGAARIRLSEKTVPTAANSADAAKGQLFGDMGLTSMLAGFRNAAIDQVGDVGDIFRRLSDIGISTGAASASTSASSDQVAGKLVIDDVKLTAALTTNGNAVRELLGASGNTNGLAQKYEALIDRQTGSTGSVLDGRITNSISEQRSFTDQIARTEMRLAAKEKRLNAQFAAMESAMQASQNQQAWLTGQLASLNNFNNRSARPRFPDPGLNTWRRTPMTGVHPSRPSRPLERSLDDLRSTACCRLPAVRDPHRTA